MTIEIQAHARFGQLVFGESNPADCQAHFGEPLRIEANRGERLEYHYTEFIVRFHETIGRLEEVTLLPGCQARINGIEVTWDKAFLKAICGKVDQVYDAYGFIVLPALGVAVTGIHDDDPPQLAITLFEKHAWDKLITKAKVFDPSTLSPDG